MLGISSTNISTASSTNAVVMGPSSTTNSKPPSKGAAVVKNTTMLKKLKKKGGKSSKNKKSSLTIKIKPFQKPPTLPPNFYDTSTQILYNSLRDILHQRTNTNTISREELYHKVTDLCSHSFGPKLYLELVQVLDDAAQTCILRLVEDGSESSRSNVENDENHPTTAKVLKYPIPRCISKKGDNNSNSTQVYFTSIKEVDLEPDTFNNDMIVDSTATAAATTTSIHNRRSIMSNEDFTLLGNIWKMYSDYVQYLNCVRLIFQSLDRMYVYLPPTTNGASTTAKATNEATTSTAHVQAQILPRNDTMITSTSISAENGIVTGPWNMWDVGMNCLYNHMSLLFQNKKQYQQPHKHTTDGDSIMEDCASTNAVAGIFNENLRQQQHYDQHHSILKALKQRTIARLIEELRNTSPASRPSSFLSLSSSNKQSGSMHQLIVRQCISIFRSFSHVSMHQTNATMKHSMNSAPITSTNKTSSSLSTFTNQRKGKDTNKFDIMEDFLSDLVSAMTTFFNKESQSYMALINDSSMTATVRPTKTGYDARAILHHVDSRLKQVKSMTSYYSLSTSTSLLSSNDSKMNLKNSNQGTNNNRSKNDSRILAQLVETEFLSPHFSINCILHPSNLHPILDDEYDGNITDVKLLFQLSKRVRSTGNEILTKTKKDFSTVPHSPGMELLRSSFERYGIESGLSIVRPDMNPNPTSATPGGAVKPPPPMTSRDIQNKIVSNLLKFKSHLEYLLKEAFSSDEYFGKTLKKVLEDVLNQGGEVSSNQNHTVMSTTDRRKRGSYRHASDGCDGGKRIAELLAKFIDLRFRNAKVSLASSPMRGVRGDSGANANDDMETFMNASLDLFRHIQSKDVFEAFYRRDLSRRLLTNKSASIDIERSFVSKLKSECGTGYTSKMEGMFKDMDLSRDVMNNYSSHVGSLEDVSAGTYKGISKSDVDMDIQVLTTGYWPVQAKHASLILPESLLARKQHFESYYLSKYQGRRIAWQNSLGNCIVKAQFPKMSSPRELNVSLCQALVLMCFNVSEGSDDDPRYTIKEIMEKAGIDDRGEAERVLQSLSMGRDGTQVLRRVEEKPISRDADGNSTTPKKKHKVIRRSISDSDIFMFNSNFMSNQKRIRITNIQMKETAEERSKTQEAVTLDRLYLIDAAIVRIMKARKTLDHRTLVGESMKQLKFPTSNTDIKKRIETLIEREYLERVEGDNSTYKYLA